MIAEQRKCLDAATLADLLAGRMPTDRFSSALEHIESCEQCMRAAEENSNNAKLPWVVEASDSSVEQKFDIEPECAAVVGNLLVQPVQTASDKSGSNVEIRPPREILGPYRLISSLGTGGMGTVYLAEHQRLKRQVALKLLPRDKLARLGWLDRFNREMTAIAALEHPNVVRALDAGDEDQWHYLVMDYLDGLDLNRVVRRIPDIAVGAACEIIRQAALGLGAIHEAGMIHRDIKPSNVFLTRTGCVKLLDLGLVLDGESPLPADERLTTVGHLMGTLPFMAREQLNDARNVDWRADIYSLGATLYRLLSGRPPYGSTDNLARTIQAISTTEAQSIATRRRDLPIELITIVDRMLSSDVSARPQSAQEVAELLQPFCDESGPKGLIRSAMQFPAEDEVSMANASRLVAPSSIAPPRSRGPWWIAAALIPFAFAAGIFVTIATDNGTLVIETDEPNAVIKIVQGDKVVDQLEVTQSRPSTLTLKSGKYLVELTGVDSDRLEVKSNQVVLSRGERLVVKVISKAPNEIAESTKPTMTASEVPTKTFHDKSLEEWTAILVRERSGEVLAQAMEGVQILVDTPEEKLAAARQFLQASRRLGGNSTVQRGSFGGGGGAGRGGSSNNPVQLPPPLTPTESLMNALEKYFPKLYSASPESGLLVIAEELENGTPQSKTACLCLLNRFLSHRGKAKDALLFDEMNRVQESQSLLQKLDKLVLETLKENRMYSQTQEKGYKLRVALNKSLERDLKLDPQIVDWAMDKLKQAKAYLGKESITLDAFTAATTYRLLEGTDLDLSSLFVGLLQSENETNISELESAITDLCRRNPVECALAVETYLIPGAARVSLFRGHMRGKLVLESFGKHHPRPVQAIKTLLEEQVAQGSGAIHDIEELFPYKLLFARVVLETDLANDPEADSKLAFAAFAFAHFEIPTEYAAKVMRIFFARFRNIKLVEDGRFSRADISPGGWAHVARSYATKSNDSRLTMTSFYVQIRDCIRRSPSAAIPALAEELRNGNDKSTLHCADLLMSTLVNLSAIDKRPFKQEEEVDQTLLSYLNTESGKNAFADLGLACDVAIERLLENPISVRSSIDESIQSIAFNRLLMASITNEESSVSETLAKGLRHIVDSKSNIRFLGIAKAIADLEGYDRFSKESLLQLAKTYELEEAIPAGFVDRIFESNPNEFRTFFTIHLESIATGTEGYTTSDLVRRVDLSKPSSAGRSIWHSIVRLLLADPDSRPRVEAASKRIIKTFVEKSPKAPVYLRMASDLDTILSPE